MKVIAVIPAFNEEKAVGETVKAIRKGLACSRVVVVDDGSVDRTAQEAERAGAAVLRLDANRGKGAAVQAALDYLAETGWDILLLADADLQASAGRLGVLSETVRKGTADMAVAAFSTGGGFGAAKRLARWGIKRLTGLRFRAPLSGQRALSRRAVGAIQPLPPGWGLEIAGTVRCLRQGLHVLEVPLDLSHRVTHKDVPGFLHRGRQFLAVVYTLMLLWSETGRTV